MSDLINKMVLDTIIKTSNNNITITDEKGLILQSNAEHWSSYGVESDYCIGKTVYQLEEEGILTPSIIAMVIKEKKTFQIMQRTNIGKILMSTAIPIFDNMGNLVRVLNYVQDQTEILNLHDEYKHLEKKLKSYKSEVEALKQKEGIIYCSKEIQQIVKTISQVAESDASVLLLGESGVGKSMFAQSIHNHSQRQNDPFIEVNCSTIPEKLFESEMFGYEAGSFTGANKQGKQGLILQAHNGTLFLDEIGELPLSMQVKLLKVLQEKKYIPIGGKKEIHVDFRLITATNKNLEEMVHNGDFRLDLYYRLNVIPLYIPSLRERKEDIILLINYYVNQMNIKYNTFKKLHSSTYDTLIQYSWPGNVRELENFIERLILTTDEQIISPPSLPNFILGQKETKEIKPPCFSEQTINDNRPLKDVLEETEKAMILKAFDQCKSTYEMAKALGISQPSVVRKLKKYKGIESEYHKV